MAKTRNPQTQKKAEDKNKVTEDKKKQEGERSGDKRVEKKDDKNKGNEVGKKQENQRSGDKKEKRKGGKKDGKEKEYKPGMSYLYEPCPHRVWTPKPGERDKSEPRGAGSPWYEPVKKKEDVDKEEAEKAKKKEEKAKKKREKGKEEKQKQKEEEDAKRKEEEEKRNAKEKKKEEKKKEQEKKKKKEENEKREKQKKDRAEEKEKKKQQEDENKGEKKVKGKEKAQASYMYEPCPHKVYTPAPGEQDLSDPKGINSPWYVPVKKKEDNEKEDNEQREKDMKKRKEERKKRENEKAEKTRQEEENINKLMEEYERKENERQARQQRKKEEREKKRREIEIEHEELGAGARDSRTDFTQEMLWMMDFISEVDTLERERRGEALRWKKEEIEEQIESYLAKEAFTKDFKYFVKTFIAAEWLRSEKKIRALEKEERRKRKALLKQMDPLAQEMVGEGERFRTLYKAGMGVKDKGSGEGKPNAMEDLMVSMIMKQLDNMDGLQLKSICGI